MNSITKKDIRFVRSIIPNCYQVSEAKQKGSIRCISNITMDGMSERNWQKFKAACRNYFKDRLEEFYHEVCTDHIDFIISVKTIVPAKRKSK